MEFYVYIHRRLDDGKIFYIGKGSGKRAWKKSTRSDWWKRIEKKHGRIVEIPFSGLTEDQAFRLEHDYVEFYGLENLCNLREGGFGGIKATEATRKKQSEARKGRKPSQETIEKMRVSSTGRHHSEETKKKLREINLGRKGTKWTEERRIKVSNLLKGKPKSIEHRVAISMAKKGKPGRLISEEEKIKRSLRLKGSKLSEEAKNKISIANKGRKHTEEEIIKMSKMAKINNKKNKRKVLCDNGMDFDCAGDAVLWLKGIGKTTARRSNIASCCTGHLKTAYGFKWTYADSR